MVGEVREAIVRVAGSSVVGLSLFGSLATGDFEAGVSDIDLLAVLAGGPDEPLVPRLRLGHRRTVVVGILPGADDGAVAPVGVAEAFVEPPGAGVVQRDARVTPP
jgi:predicted nucleotidyltransferase